MRIPVIDTIAEKREARLHKARVRAAVYTGLKVFAIAAAAAAAITGIAVLVQKGVEALRSLDKDDCPVCSKFRKLCHKKKEPTICFERFESQSEAAPAGAEKQPEKQ